MRGLDTIIHPVCLLPQWTTSKLHSIIIYIVTLVLLWATGPSKSCVYLGRNVSCNVICYISPALEHELQHYFLHKEIFRTLRTTSTAGVNNFLWWIEWDLRNWPDQTKTKNTNQNTNKYMFKRVCVLKCVHQEDQPHCKNNVYNYIYYIMYKKNAY